MNANNHYQYLRVFAAVSLLPLTAVPLCVSPPNAYKCEDMESVSLIKTVCRTDAAAEPPWMACFACLRLAGFMSGLLN